MSQPIDEDQSGANGAGTGSAEQPATKAYTQEQIDALVESRLQRERAKFADYTDLKKKAGEFDKLREQSKSEQERAVDAARKEGAAAAAERWKSRLVSSEVRAQAARLRFHDPADAVAQLHASLGGIQVSDDGDLDGESISKALTELAKAKPYLVVEEKPGRAGGDAGQGPRGGTGPTNMNELIRGLGRR
jgi:hypothetical protein